MIEGKKGCHLKQSQGHAIPHYHQQPYSNLYWFDIDVKVMMGSCGIVGMVEFGLSQSQKGKTKVGCAHGKVQFFGLFFRNAHVEG